ncbi:MAG: 3-methyl-2-oxobutanoate hydroxymethyltransferase [Synechococcus sp. ELA057]
MRPSDLLIRKQEGLPISVLTAWDALSAALVAEAGADAVLVGDSLAMTVLGHGTTLPVTLDEMLHHCRAVGRGLEAWTLQRLRDLDPASDHGAPPERRQLPRSPLLICDLPFLSYQCGSDDGLRAAGRVLKESPAMAVKLEGAEPETLAVIDRMVRSGIPVMGHLGLTPQSVHQTGYRRQARDPRSQEKLRHQAERLEACGCFSVVLEHVPSELAEAVRQTLRIPVIGIGAGDACDGQVRVTADLLGYTERQPPFSPPLLDGRGLAVHALREWISALSCQSSPTSPAAPAAPHC